MDEMGRDTRDMWLMHGPKLDKDNHKSLNTPNTLQNILVGNVNKI